MNVFAIGHLLWYRSDWKKAPNGGPFGALGCTGKLLRDSLHDGDLLAVLAQPLKLDAAVLQGKQGIVLADAHVGAGMDVGAALTDQNVAGQNELPVAPLDAQTLEPSESRPFRVEPTPFLCAKN